MRIREVQKHTDPDRNTVSNHHPFPDALEEQVFEANNSLKCCSAAGAMRSLRETQLPTGTIGSPEETFV
jgi:hypothetical protein